jgi:prohibitin 2
VVWPWDRLYQYDLRLNSASETFKAISKDGVGVTAQISIRYQLRHNYVGALHKFIGPDYLTSVLSPEIGSKSREVISQYTAQEVYTSRKAIQEKIRNESQKSLASHLNSLVQTEAMEQPDPKHYNEFLQNAIQILDTLVLNIDLPPSIVDAINRQTQQYYEIQEFKFRVEREAQESKRKQIEAYGIAAFQRTVSQGISDSYLRWRGIEATLALAQSTNSKIVIIGNSKDGLPIILGNVDTPAAPNAGPKSAEGNAIPSDKTPIGNAPTEANQKTSATSAPTSPEKKPAADSSAATASSDKQKNSSNLLNLSDIESALSRITEGLRPSGSAPNSDKGVQPKQ